MLCTRCGSAMRLHSQRRADGGWVGPHGAYRECAARRGRQATHGATLQTGQSMNGKPVPPKGNVQVFGFPGRWESGFPFSAMGKWMALGLRISSGSSRIRASGSWGQDLPERPPFLGYWVNVIPGTPRFGSGAPPMSDMGIRGREGEEDFRNGFPTEMGGFPGSRKCGPRKKQAPHESGGDPSKSGLNPQKGTPPHCSTRGL